MLTLEKIKSEFSYKELGSDNEFYHNEMVFEGHGEFCDVYFRSKKKEIKQDQVDAFNSFKNSFQNNLKKIEHFLYKSLKNSELNKSDIIKNSILMLDVIDVPFDNHTYDAVLVCGKTYKNLFLFNKHINIRVEFKNQKIKSIQRKKDTTLENF